MAATLDEQQIEVREGRGAEFGDRAAGEVIRSSDFGNTGVLGERDVVADVADGQRVGQPAAGLGLRVDDLIGADPRQQVAMLGRARLRDDPADV